MAFCKQNMNMHMSLRSRTYATNIIYVMHESVCVRIRRYITYTHTHTYISATFCDDDIWVFIRTVYHSSISILLMPNECTKRQPEIDLWQRTHWFWRTVIRTIHPRARLRVGQVAKGKCPALALEGQKSHFPGGFVQGWRARVLATGCSHHSQAATAAMRT